MFAVYEQDGAFPYFVESCNCTSSKAVSKITEASVDRAPSVSIWKKLLRCRYSGFFICLSMVSQFFTLMSVCSSVYLPGVVFLFGDD